jgi:hypothetical protein
MQLYRATALIAVVLIVLLSAGYAAGEKEPPVSPETASSRASGL